MALPTKKTKIVCTIGPASQDQETLEQMLLMGMNVARLNFAHGDFESHAQVIENLRAAAHSTGKRVAIMGDLPGPKMRIGKLVEEPLTLEHGQSFILQTEEILGDDQRVSLSFNSLPEVVAPGDLIYINDGFIQLEVHNVAGDQVICEVQVGGELRSFKGVNFPGIDLGIGAFTERDHEFLKFAAQHGLDAVGQSFVQGPEDIIAV
ncbi:MAG: pyruvate kinase, partial [Anaerolineales bacterium]|nr:pyruvate kinase [Anaerolineales bacterium]